MYATYCRVVLNLLAKSQTWMSIFCENMESVCMAWIIKKLKHLKTHEMFDYFIENRLL